MEFDTQVKLTVYRHFAETGRRPSLEEVVEKTGSDSETVRVAYDRLRAARVLVLEEDGVSIRMAPPFSGVAMQHEVESAGVRYYANCAWDALGVAAALQREATVHSQCAQSGESLVLKVVLDGPEHSDWLFHSLLPAARWWDDIIFT